MLKKLLSKITKSISHTSSSSQKNNIPELPKLHLYYVDLEYGGQGMFLSYKDYVDKSDGISLYEEDKETLAQWKKDNPNWAIDVENKKIWKI